MSPGIGLASGRPAQQQRDLAVGGGVLGQIVDDQQHVASLRHEVLGHGAGAIGRQPLQPRRCVGLADRRTGSARARRSAAPPRSPRATDDSLLADRGIDADHLARPLVDDGVDGDRGLAGAAVADDQFALAAAERDHRIDDQQPGRQAAASPAPGRRSPAPAARPAQTPRQRPPRRRRAATPSASTTRPSSARRPAHAPPRQCRAPCCRRRCRVSLAEQDAADRLLAEIDGKTPHPAIEQRAVHRAACRAAR